MLYIIAAMACCRPPPPTPSPRRVEVMVKLHGRGKTGQSGSTSAPFKPTKAKEVPFRPTEEEALSYFVTGIIPEDTGFAIAPYTAVSFDNHGCIFDSDSATCMGEYYFTGTDSSVTKVEYTFGYKKDAEGNLKIVVHHSSLP